MKYSKQRDLIEQAVKAKKLHPTAEDVYLSLKEDNPRLSLATVYRNLNGLAQQGIIKKLYMPVGSDRFDAEPTKHDHVICKRCGKIFDVQLPFLSQLPQFVYDSTQVRLSDHQCMMYGICPQCDRRGK